MAITLSAVLVVMRPSPWTPLTKLSTTETNKGDQAMVCDGEYNYHHFHHINDPAFEAFRSHLPVGSTAPDGVLTRLDDGARVTLQEYFRSGPVVIEFGSLT